MSTIMKRMSAMLVALVLALVGFGATAAYADTSKYAQSLELTGLSDGETVQAYKLMSYGSDYNTYVYDDTTTGGKTSFKAYLEAAAQKDSKSADDYLASLSGDNLSSFLGTYLYGTETYAKPSPAETTVSGTSAKLTLEPGYYLISIKTTTAGANVYKPFSAFVKMNGEASAIKAGDGDWGTATVAMKSTKGPSIEKKVMRANGTDMDSSWKDTKTVAVGETVTYRVKLTVPDWQRGTTPRLELEDTLVNQQYETNSIALWSEEGSEGSKWMPSTRVESSISENEIGAYTNGKQSISFSIDYSKLTGGKTYYITYTTKVMSDITGSSNAGDMKATNTAKVVYSTSDATTSTTTESKTTLYTYSAKLTKQDVDGKLLPGSGFTVYSDEKCTQAINFEKVTNADGSWYYRAKDTGDVTEILADGNDSYLLIKGLDPYKDYYFKETTTPKGYYAPSNAFKLDLDSQMTEADETEHSGTLSIDSTVTALDQVDSKLVSGNVDAAESNQYDIVIKNSSTPSLPTTGGMGTLLFTIAGLALMVVAAAVYFARRRKSNN